ncbi:MAG: hypothetical protein EHM41_10835 [Chloroflexi bacterium]|nr:MAG: hypothetical protein EHM41_10835 [Chloroflexota bacterium]
MASWIVHLRIAELLLEKIPGLDPSSFAVGNIAPDSGMPDEKWETFTPPTEVTHIIPERGSNMCADLLFYRKYLVEDPLAHRRGEKDGKRASFLWGYFSHLVTDNLWRVEIGLPTQEKYKEQFEADKDFIWEVKKDWYGLDFLYVREHPNSLFWRVFLNCSYNENYLDFLLIEGVQDRIRYIQDYYRRDDEKIEAALRRPFEYLSKQRMDRFVDEASDFLFRVYQNLVNENSGQEMGPSGILTAPPWFS